jgi:cytochrome c5
MNLWPGQIDLGGWDLLPWAAAGHAVALPAALAVAVARFRATVPPPVRWVAITGAAGAAATFLLALALRLASPRAAATLGVTFGPVLGLVLVLLVAAFGWSLVQRHFATGITAFLLALALAAAAAPLSFMTTPGEWPTSRALADAILNPTFLPLLLGRAGVATAFCGTCLLLCATRGGEGQRPRALAAGSILSLAGAGGAALATWLWLRALGPAPREALLGEAWVAAGAARIVARAGPAFAAVAVLVAFVSFLQARWMRRGAVALLVLLAGVAAGSAEVARVALSGPWSVGAPGAGWLYANGLTAGEVETARGAGLAAVLPAVGPAGARPSAERGALVAAAACAPCHSNRGLAARLEGWPAAAIAAAAARLDRLSAASPPFPGDAADARDLAAHLALLDGNAGGALAPPDPASIKAGRKAFERTCAHCHREIRLNRRVAGWNEPLARMVVARLPRMNPAMEDVRPEESERAALAAYLVTLGAR